MNQLNIIGRVGKDPETKDLESGTKIAKFTLAVSENVTKNNEKVTITEWFNIAVFGKLAEVVEKWVHKGDQLYVTGKFQSREYEKDGEKKRFYEVNANGIEMLGGKKESSPQAEPASNRPVSTPLEEMPADDLPF
jgi:single-strand DNA-binding protein